MQGSPRTLLLALVVCLSHVAAKSAALSEALVTKHGVLKPLTAFVQGANTPPDIKAASLNASAQVGAGPTCIRFSNAHSSCFYPWALCLLDNSVRAFVSELCLCVSVLKTCCTSA
mmetsp:Transcript_2778/g.7200  ORF Transcript_2778/g.7200 Transcript_2778/m.7200 type:complete len:115 (-) Transcript_2778:2234-2578(-)